MGKRAWPNVVLEADPSAATHSPVKRGKGVGSLWVSGETGAHATGLMPASSFDPPEWVIIGTPYLEQIGDGAPVVWQLWQHRHGWSWRWNGESWWQE